MAATNDDGYTFAEWLSRANDRVAERAGLRLADLPDGAERYAWHDGVSPASYADDLLDEEGCPS